MSRSLNTLLSVPLRGGCVFQNRCHVGYAGTVVCLGFPAMLLMLMMPAPSLGVIEPRSWLISIVANAPWKAYNSI